MQTTHQNISYPIASLDVLQEATPRLLAQGSGLLTWCFHGALGSGKTTLIRSICQHLGVQQQVTSPTFSLIHEYEAATHKIYHCDFYRLTTAQEALDIGLERYFTDRDLVFIEWPELVVELLPTPYFDVVLTRDDSGERLMMAGRRGHLAG